ncbi:MAG: MBL fold metallo-hydrolase [Tatlockia sp.]|nr:MBL fold metallo-hydrolase [Tatlockia sp.]
MLSDIYILQTIENLDLLITNCESSAEKFTRDKNKISKNLFYETGSDHLEGYLQTLIDHLTSNEADYDNPLYVNLLSTMQYFLNLKNNQIISELNLDLKDLGRQELSQKRLGHFSPANSLYKNSVIDTLPKIQYDPHQGHYTSPDDDKAHQHGAEAGNIFFSTQLERFKGLVNWLFAKIGIYIFETARYQEHDYLDSDIYAYDTPRAGPKENSTQYYWVGHATNYIVYPNNGKPLHVLTDPFEGNMTPVIYPRMTSEGKLIDGEGATRLPKVDVVIISHNHLDHVSKTTLKRLVKQQPKMIIPQGDKELFVKLGFTDIVELEWWEQAKIKDSKNNEVLRVTATPARHWSGRGLDDAHRSAFNGYVLESNNKAEGDIYFAGDTALMDDSLTRPIFEHFNIMTSIQPGGPDECREDMESTHQSSVDGIEMHFKMLLGHYQKMTQEKGQAPSFGEFQDQTKQVKTIYNHTSTFKLGNLRLKDTTFSYNRLVAAFKESEIWRSIHLPAHEMKTFNMVSELANKMVFAGEKQLDKKEIVKLILNSVIIPKIGQRQSLYEAQKMGPAQSFQFRNLITNRRALIEYDTILKEYIVRKDNLDIADVKKILIKLIDSYQNPWHSFLSRTFKPENLNDRYHKMISDCKDLPGLTKALNKMEEEMGYRKPNEQQTHAKFNQHGHMQSLIHYSKWVVSFAKDHKDAGIDKFKEYFACQQIRKLVDQEVHNSGWFIEGGDRSSKQKAFRTLADQLAKVPAQAYGEVFTKWKEEERTDGQINKELLAKPRSIQAENETTHSMKILSEINTLINKGFFANHQAKHAEVEDLKLSDELNII